MLKIHASWKIDVTKFPQPKQYTHLLIDAPGAFPIDGGRAIFVQAEPQAISGLRNYMIQYSSRYAYILTFDEEVLRKCQNAVKCVFGSCWISSDEWNSVVPSEKQFKVSCITGAKGITEGHKFRIDTYMHQNEITIPHQFFIGQNAPLPIIENNNHLGDRKFKLFDGFQFSIVIENSRQANYFTEKLIDCLITKTIPIYYGCPNIHEYFDVTGWIILDSTNVDTLIEKINSLTNEHYMSHIETVHKNFQIAQYYSDFDLNIGRALRSIKDY